MMKIHFSILRVLAALAVLYSTSEGQIPMDSVAIKDRASIEAAVPAMLCAAPEYAFVSLAEVDVPISAALGLSSLSSFVQRGARITYGKSCGFAKAGVLAYVTNTRTNRRVRVTVKVEWWQGIESGSYERVYTLPAGGSRSLGCTRGSGVSGASKRYSVIGCQVL